MTIEIDFYASRETEMWQSLKYVETKLKVSSNLVPETNFFIFLTLSSFWREIKNKQLKCFEKNKWNVANFSYIEPSHLFSTKQQVVYGALFFHNQ